MTLRVSGRQPSLGLGPGDPHARPTPLTCPATLLPSACVCIYDGQRFRPGDTIYQTTDGTGGCISAHCGANGTIERRVHTCSPTTSTPQTTFSFSTPPMGKAGTLGAVQGRLSQPGRVSLAESPGRPEVPSSAFRARAVSKGAQAGPGSLRRAPQSSPPPGGHPEPCQNSPRRKESTGLWLSGPHVHTVLRACPGARFPSPGSICLLIQLLCTAHPGAGCPLSPTTCRRLTPTDRLTW